MDWSRIVRCKHCSAGNPCDVALCIRCGTLLALDSDVQQQNFHDDSNQTQNLKKTIGQYFLTMLVCVVLVLILPPVMESLFSIPSIIKERSINKHRLEGCSLASCPTLLDYDKFPQVNGFGVLVFGKKCPYHFSHVLIGKKNGTQREIEFSDDVVAVVLAPGEYQLAALQSSFETRFNNEVTTHTKTLRLDMTVQISANMLTYLGVLSVEKTEAHAPRPYLNQTSLDSSKGEEVMISWGTDLDSFEELLGNSHTDWVAQIKEWEAAGRLLGKEQMFDPEIIGSTEDQDLLDAVAENSQHLARDMIVADGSDVYSLDDGGKGVPKSGDFFEIRGRQHPFVDLEGFIQGFREGGAGALVHTLSEHGNVLPELYQRFQEENVNPADAFDPSEIYCRGCGAEVPFAVQMRYISPETTVSSYGGDVGDWRGDTCPYCKSKEFVLVGKTPVAPGQGWTAEDVNNMRRYYREIARLWWSQRDGDAICDSCNDAVPHGQGGVRGHIRGNELYTRWLHCEACFAKTYDDPEFLQELERDPDYAGTGLLDEVREWAADNSAIKSSGSTEDLQKKGESLFWSGTHTDALNCFRAIIERESNNILARLWLSDCYHELGDYDSALAAIHEALRIDPNDERFPSNGLFTSRGVLELKKGELLAAVKSFKEALTRHKCADVQPLNWLGAIYAHTGLPNEAEYLLQVRLRCGQPYSLTPEADMQVRRLCEATDTHVIRQELWQIAELEVLFDTNEAH